MNMTLKPRVLLADDHEPLLRMLKRLLLRDGFEVVLATSGEAALTSLAEDNDFAAIVSDMSMGPGMDGNGLFEAVHTKHPHLVDRFVFFTGEPDRCRGGQVVAKGGSFEDLRDVLRALR